MSAITTNPHPHHSKETLSDSGTERQPIDIDRNATPESR